MKGLLPTESVHKNNSVAIKVAGLSKSYGKLKALEDVSFAIQRGTIFGYLGPNGAGKTTTIKILCGLLEREAGEVNIGGADIALDPVRVKQRIGVTPDESNLYPELSCQRNLEYLGELYGLPRSARQARRRELLETFALTDKAHTPFGALSHGMKRRLTLAAALVHAPEILFLDEPTTGLDAPSARSLRQLIQKINREQHATIFLTTHNLYEAEVLCHQILIIYKGRVVAEGTVPEIRRRVGGLKNLEVTFDQEVDANWWQVVATRGTPPAYLDGRWRLKIASHEVNLVLGRLLAWAEAAGVKIMDLVIGEVNLEEAFLAILEEKSQSKEGSV
ncbi:ABC transporter ATP-binding protein [Desulfobacca acetoxidans]|uniref:Sulfate-transporting ATPase n=1 Tax=Desulfobacca acetoxidans (strain ATCC 700848 / DSM 11109 / ASRB2) TaxID=880072 RepID=F2NI64_DESAR|nr:ABC transporter ATP-binding protein [Desulfobacca acetoxidans]AEB09833.1 Sulfate-transporting ATPase [Desulfobacca acetoxidans DSM 11109]